VPRYNFVWPSVMTASCRVGRSVKFEIATGTCVVPHHSALGSQRMWHLQMEEIRAQLAATCEPRQIVNATFDRVFGLVEKAAEKALSMERMGTFYVSSSTARNREAKRFQDEVRWHGASWSLFWAESCHCK